MTTEEQNERLRRFAERYASGDLPWDAELPPPEIVAAIAGEPAGRALDLGCGHGRTSIYLAQQGWVATGVDFVPAAIVEARRRAQEAGVSDKATFLVASVLDLESLPGPYDLAVDIGCFHAFDAAERSRYAAQLRRLLRPGGRFLHFSHLQQSPEPPPDSSPRPTVPDIHAAFANGFTLERQDLGRDPAGGEESRLSGWFWWRRTSEEQG